MTTPPQAMRSLGLNPNEQEVIDIPNYITRRGLIYFNDFCQMILKWFRDDVGQEEHFKQLMFRVGWEILVFYLVNDDWFESCF